MANYSETKFKCRSTRPVRVYRTVYDTEPSMIVLKSGKEFVSMKQYQNGTTDLFHITEALSEDVPIGYWCPANVIQTQFISVSTANVDKDYDGSEKTYVAIEVKQNSPVVYSGDTAISTGLTSGDRIFADRKIIVDKGNGYSEERYRIRATTSEDQTVVGKWIIGNRLFTTNGIETVITNPYVTIVPAKLNEQDIVMLDTLDYGNVNSLSLFGGDIGIATMEASGSGGGFFADLINTAFGYDSDSVDKVEVSIPEYDVTQNNTNSTSGWDTDSVINHMNIEDNMQALYNAYGFDYSGITTASSMSVPIGSMIFVHGMPFQFTAITDRRDSMSYDSGYTGKSPNDTTPATDSGGLKGSNVDSYGRSFASNIAANMPIVVIAPGKPRFMTSVKEGIGGYITEAISDIRNTFLPLFNAQSDTEFGSILANLNNIEGDFQYYTMEIDTSSYFKYVNSICRSSAYLMGLSDVQYHGKKCPDLDWGDYNTAAEQDFSIFEQVMGLSAGVSFAYDPQSSVSDTISNSTTESQFMSMFNDVSSKARELEFITGYSGLDTGDLFDSTNYRQQATTQLNSGAFAGLQNVIDRVGTWMRNSVHGMNMRFPEIWSDSSNSRSYEIDMHFVAPYATAFCKWRYVLVPFFHVFCLAAPKSDTHVSQYSAPFLIRAYSKGYFNVEMGIIESITWKRFGDGNMISDDGIPTQIDVTIAFKDLYHTLAMTEFYGDGLATNVSNFMNNTGLIDLIGTLSGVNMNRVNISERLAMFASTSMNALGSMGSNFMRDISDKMHRISDRLHLYGV